MGSHRLASGGLIHRGQALSFTFDGKSQAGFSGDTLASALLANGQMLIGRSFKYHRPRGLVTAGSAEPNGLVSIGSGARTQANTRATMAELHEGLVAESQNRWPSLTIDIGAINSLLSPFLAAGFYYKTFMWPASFWEKVYEPIIRRAAGLGRLVTQADPDRYEKAWAHCDLLVIGAGPTGLMAALSAGRAGARVILADEGFRFGGSLLSEGAAIGGLPAPQFSDAVIAELASLPNVTLMRRTTVFGWYDDMVFGAVEQVQKHVAEPNPDLPVERLWRIVARRAILAAGAEERPLVFGGNDRPGVMTAGAARSYLNRFGVAVGRKVAVFTTGGSGYELARDLLAAGVEVTALIDPRPSSADPVPEGLRLIRGGMVTSTKGHMSLKAVVTERSGYEEEIACDALAMSGGWSPIVHLMCQRGARPVWSEERQAFLAPDVGAAFVPAGGAAGLLSLAACLKDGAERAIRLCRDLGFAAHEADLPEVEGSVDPAFSPLWYVPGSKGKAFVDFQNDVTVADLGLSQREGYRHAEMSKRYTTAGMATDQGKLGNVNTIGIMAGMRGLSPAQIGTTTYRPFYTPVSFGALAGTARAEQARPVRRSPLHVWAAKNGAAFVEAGAWYRSAWFAREGEKTWRESVDREVRTVRESAGLCDVSTLGKIEIFGSDAAEFLNRIYCNGFLKLPVGKARYGVMLREDGIVFDDGTTSRLGQDHYLMTTTTGHAEEVMTHLEFAAQALWPELHVCCRSTTEQWAQMSIAGPKARIILQRLVEADLSNAAFPVLSARAVTLKGGLGARLFRISFSGELAYELAVPAGFGEAVADAVMQAGYEEGICAYGVEALNVLRIEKGHVTHSEFDGRTTADDVGLGRMMAMQKPDFIGKRLSTRFGLTAADRLQMVGLMPIEADGEMKAGAHLLKEHAKPSMTNDQGFVSSACYSPTLNRFIALAMLKSGRERYGEKILVWDPLRGSEVLAEVCPPVFVDPDNLKLQA
ncbi:sarcosine oxidase subunit alpha family protein [Rhizobium sp. SSA_523]|uniref:sarcosine oxidase subunit alpha family protein n=1 Tax=Rhizobium sp. SSA_523 TaxID=2952477 RepID=UPI002091DBBC|nr:sarcosine oxidase subunit alpha family protein [Rhizobium sp. SSA_523]MCO5732074.1 sarcosine oxidase subunit alpha family protein [Rhizobium sp. SSA_523]WKC22589.1 sarcosine oxidase subunit alpha family protein [Rhizobium sp. SSA_523]